MTEIDFTNCPKVAGRAYNGANGKKLAVKFEGATWILKFPPNAADRPNELSYSNSCVSEHLGSSVFRLLGIPAQETRLGTYVNGRAKVVCGCLDFTRPGVRLMDFCSIKNSVLETGSGGTGTELDDVLKTIEQQQFMDPTEVLARFWDMFVVDALLGNFDRHNGNWGFLVEEATGKAQLAPVFDCGSCLLPQADEQVMQRCLKDPNEMAARIYTFPASMLKRDGVKIGYCKFIAESADEGLRAAMARLLPGIAALDFGMIVADTPYLSAVQRQFLVAYFNDRRAKVFEGSWAGYHTLSPEEAIAQLKEDKGI